MLNIFILWTDYEVLIKCDSKANDKFLFGGIYVF